VAVTDWKTGNSTEWDTLFLDEKPLPGVAQVSLKMPPGIDIQKATGSRAARIVDTGLPPIMLHCRLTMTTAEQVNALAPFMPVLRPKAKGSALKKVRVTHPQAVIWGFTDVIVYEIEAPPIKPGGAYIVEFSMAEWFPQPKKIKDTKPNSGTPGTGGKTPKQLADEVRDQGKKAREGNT
jgi:hypothetical protein